jgi:hypothetical protein
MAQPLTLTYGRVKYPPQEPRQTKNGLRINAVVTLPSGEEVKLWGDPGDPTLTALTRGQQVALAQNAKGGWQLVQQHDESVSANGNSSVQNQTESHTEWTPEQKRAIASRIEERAKLMKYCLAQAREHCGEYLETSEDLRAIATTLFLEALKG